MGRISRDHPLLLASASPRRRELLELARIPFEVIRAGVDESIAKGEHALAYVARMARAKLAAAVIPLDETTRARAAVVLAADTTVDPRRSRLRQARERRRGARRCSARSRERSTRSSRRSRSATRSTGRLVSEQSVRTLVEFRVLDAKEIDDYVATGESRDKAGRVRDSRHGERARSAHRRLAHERDRAPDGGARDRAAAAGALVRAHGRDRRARARRRARRSWRGRTRGSRQIADGTYYDLFARGSRKASATRWRGPTGSSRTPRTIPSAIRSILSLAYRVFGESAGVAMGVNAGDRRRSRPLRRTGSRSVSSPPRFAAGAAIAVALHPALALVRPRAHDRERRRVARRHRARVRA